MSRPVIGVSCAVERARWGPWDQRALILPTSYAAAVQGAGALALLLAPDPAVSSEPDELLDLLDGLILSGGSDLDPGSYGADRHPETGPTGPERDAFEVALAGRAIELEVPLLGICRGMHVLNVARGGTLEQHLPDTLGHENHRPVPGRFVEHEVELAPRSRAAEVAGGGRLEVKSHHHQGLGRLGAGIVATGASVPDGVVEAIELPSCSFAVGVLWHPEEEERAELIGRFVRTVAGAAAGADQRRVAIEASR